MNSKRKPKIHRLVLKGEVQELQQELAGGADPNRLWTDGLTPLHLAVDQANLEMTRILLAAGGNPAAVYDPNGENALHLAASRGATEIVSLLIEYGLDPTQKDGRGWTPLHHAASGGEGTLTTTLYLLDLGVSPNELTHEHETPLILAAIASNLSVTYALVYVGASLSQCAEYGWDALKAAEFQLEAALQYPKQQHQIRVDRDLVRILNPKGLD